MLLLYRWYRKKMRSMKKIQKTRDFILYRNRVVPLQPNASGLGSESTPKNAETPSQGLRAWRGVFIGVRLSD